LFKLIIELVSVRGRKFRRRDDTLSTRFSCLLKWLTKCTLRGMATKERREENQSSKATIGRRESLSSLSAAEVSQRQTEKRDFPAPIH
jgi:hypothetical protein